MSGAYHRVRKRRSKHVTHFSEDVSMRPLNDPIHPFHPGTPEPVTSSVVRYYDIDLSELAPARVRVPHPPTLQPETGPVTVSASAIVPDSLRSVNDFEDLPLNFHLSQKTRRLLQDVDNISKQYTGQRAEQLMSTDRKIEIDSNVHEEPISQGTETLSEKENGFKIPNQNQPKRKRVIGIMQEPVNNGRVRTKPPLKRCSPEPQKFEFGFSQKSARFENEGPPRKPEQLKSKKIGNNSGKFDHGVNEAPSRKTSDDQPQILKSDSNTKFPENQPQDRGENDSRQDPEILENSAKKSEEPIANSSNEEQPNNITKVVESKFDTPWVFNPKPVEIDDDQTQAKVDEKEVDRKPWRKNMKKVEEKPIAPPSPPKCTCPRTQDPDVRKYIKAKRKLLVAQEKEKEKAEMESESKKKENLLALEIWRRNNSLKSSIERTSTEEGQEVDLNKNDRVKIKKDQLVNLLTALTKEMKDKYYNQGLLTDMIERANSEANNREKDDGPQFAEAPRKSRQDFQPEDPSQGPLKVDAEASNTTEQLLEYYRRRVMENGQSSWKSNQPKTLPEERTTRSRLGSAKNTSPSRSHTSPSKVRPAATKKHSPSRSKFGTANNTSPFKTRPTSSKAQSPSRSQFGVANNTSPFKVRPTSSKAQSPSRSQFGVANNTSPFKVRPGSLKTQSPSRSQFGTANNTSPFKARPTSARGQSPSRSQFESANSQYKPEPSMGASSTRGPKNTSPSKVGINGTPPSRGQLGSLDFVSPSKFNLESFKTGSGVSPTKAKHATTTSPSRGSRSPSRPTKGHSSDRQEEVSSAAKSHKSKRSPEKSPKMLASKDDPCSPLDQLESLASRKDLLENYPQLAKLLHKKKSRHGKEHRKKHKIQSTDEHVRHDRVAADVHQPEEISQTSEAKTGFKSIERNERQTSGAKTGFKSTERNERQTSEAKTGFKSIERNEHQHLEAKTGFKSTERNERQTSEAKTGFKSIERSERQYMEAQMVESKPVERHKSKSRDDFEQEIVFHVKSGDDGGQLLKSVSDVADGVISNQLNANEKFSNKSAKMHEPNSKQVFGSKEKKPLQTFLPDELASPDQEDPISRQSTYASISLKSSLASNQVQPVIPQTYQTHPSSSKSLNHQNLESGLKQDKTSWSRPEQHTATNQNVQQQQLQDQYSRSRSIQSADQSKKDDDPLFRLGQEINSRLSNDQKMPEGPSRFQSVQERDKKLHSERSQPVGDRDIRSRSDLFEERRSSEVDRRRDWNPRSESGKEKNEIRSKLEQLQERHMEDMKIIKKSNLDIVIPEPDLSQNKLRSSSDFDASRKSNVSHQNQSLNVVKEIPKAFSDRGKPWSGSEAESQPPGLQHADPATPDPDPFNFMNSVKRKFEAQFHRSDFINVDSSRDPVSEISMAISEGPLSTISSSSSSKVLNIVYDKSSKEKLPKDKWSNQIPLFGDDSGHTKEAKQQQHEHLFVPAALQLRFQAELNQLEGIQEAERQINHINHIREVVTARNDAAAMAQLLQQGLGRSLDETESSSKPVRRTSRSSSIGGETRAEFEARMKLHMEELLNKRMQKFLEQQTEATRATADAAKQLGKLFKTRKGESRNSEHRKIESRNTETRKGESRNTETRKGESRETETSGKNTELSEDILTLMSKAESNIPEVMSLAENTERSGGSIQRTISDAIRVLSVEEEQSTKSGDITEEIAGDLSSTATEIVATIMEQEKSTTSSRQTKVSTRKSKKDETLSEASIESSSSSSSEKGSTLTSSAESFSKFAGKLSRQNIQEQMTRLQHKMIMVDAKEKLLEERYKRELIKISQQAMESPDSDKNVRALKKRLVQSYRQRKAELDLLRESLRAEERDLKFLASQEKKLSRAGAKSSHLLAMSLDNENFLSPSPSSLSASFDGFSVLNVEANRKNKIGENVEPEKRKLVDRRTHRSEELRLSISGVPPLKPPLSPKASTSGIPRRRHHSSADSDESINISQADTVSDHSGLEICISALQAELRGCIRQAENLKRQRKKSVKAEQLKVQEDAHRQQVETFDKLIVTKLAELDEVVQPGQKASIVQPKIKVPRVSGRTTGLQPQMSVEAESPEFGDTSQKTFSSLSRASSTDTILASPKKLISEEVPDISIDISSDSLMVDMTDKSKFIPTSDELSENNVSPDSPHQVDTASQASQPSHTETILESPKKIAFDNSFSTKSQRPETRSVKEDEEPSESEIVSRTKASDASIEKSNSETFEREDETQDQSDKAESIPENIEEQTASQAVESDLNYSDDFTSSSSTSESNLVIKTTLRSKLPPDTTLQKTCQVDGSQKLDLVQGIKPAESKGEAFSIESEDKSDQFEPESEKTKIESQEIVIASYLGDMDVPKVFDKEPFKSEEASKKKDRDDLVEEICETILEELVHDALNTFTLARAKTLAPSSEAKSHNFGKDVKETDRNNHSIEDVKGNNISQVEQLQKRPQPPSIISPRSGKSIQELMLTTFDLSSDSSQDSGSEDSSIPTQYPPLTVALDKLSDRSTDINKLSDSSTGKSNLSDRSTDNNKLSDSSTGKSNLVESSTDIDKLLDSSTDFDGGDFIDDDFGLSIRQESEKLRQQQILIEQEISRIQQEKQAIPDKPPPPYTPPSSPRPTRTRPNLETTKFVPSTRQDIVNLVPGMVRSVLASRPEIASLLGKDNSDAGAKPRVEQTVVPTGPSRDKFISFLNDQVCDIIDDVYRCKSEKQNPPWMPRKPLEKEQLALPKSVPELIARVTREVLVAFHYEKRAAKENLVVRWSQKRRDRVDQILVRELHSEEAAWTNYSSDEAAVKDQLSEGLMDSLISDTVATFKRIFEARKNV